MRWWQKRDRPEPAPPPPPPPWETALAELHELERARAAAVSEGRTEQWVDAVSDSIRAYLGRRFGFHGLESTTDEIADQLAGRNRSPSSRKRLLDFSGSATLVKFAKASLADEASRTLIEEALALVDQTRPAAVVKRSVIMTPAQRRAWAVGWLAPPLSSGSSSACAGSSLATSS